MPLVIPERTVQDPTVADVKTITFSRQSNGSGGFVTISTAYYELVDGAGEVAITGSVSTQLGATPQSQLATYITNHILPAIESAEGF